MNRSSVMKKFFSTFILFLICFPVLLLTYQNCSELNSSTLESVNQLSSMDHPPYFVNDLSLLNYNDQSCNPDMIKPLMLYSKKYNLCTQTQISCEAEYLIKMGFSENENALCDSAPDIESNNKTGKFLYISTTSLGYRKYQNQACTTEYRIMINFKNHTCSEGSDGCKINFLKTQDYIEDIYENCPSKP